MHVRVLAFAAAALIAAVAPATTYAHEGNPNFNSELDGVEPPVDGLDAHVLNYDDSLEVRNDTGETLIVEGYQGEPYIRIDPDGAVYLNKRSPAYYLNDDRYGKTEAPAGADPKAEPAWGLVDRTGQYAWHDHRIHYMSTNTPSQVTDESERTKIFDYRVPIEVGGRAAAITGTLFWVGEPGGLPIAPFIALSVLTLIGVAAVLIRRRRRDDGVEPKEAW